jgi:predicted transcriptional regulator YheO
MKYTQDQLPLLNSLIESLAKHFGSKYEFVVHDYSKDFGSTIVAIANGELTGRSVGKGGTDIGLKVLQGLVEEDGRYNYITQTQDGRLLRSSTIYLRDDDDKVIGSLCINFDITDLIRTKDILEGLINFGKTEENKVEAVVFENIEDLLISIIQESISYIGVPVVSMTREQKVEGIFYLNKRGVFKIKNAANVVANYYDISKYTVYNYINETDVDVNR